MSTERSRPHQDTQPLFWFEAISYSYYFDQKMNLNRSIKMPKVTSPLSVLDVEMVQWSAYLPSILTTRVWFSPTSKLLFLLFYNKNSYRNPKFNLLEFTCTVLKIKMSFFLPLFGLFRLFHTQQANTNSYKIVNQKVCSCALLPTVAQPQTYSSLFFI